MAPLVDHAFLDKLILEQRKTIRTHTFFLIGLVVLGLIIMFLAFILPSRLSQTSAVPEYVYSGIFGIGSAFFVSLSSFPYKDISNRNDKIVVYEFIKEKIQMLEKTPRTKRAELERQLEQLSEKILDKLVVG